jgi:hypothetical protein
MSTLVTNELFAQPGRGTRSPTCCWRSSAKASSTMAARPSGSCAIKTTRITSPESRNGLIPPGVFGPTRPSRSGPTLPVPASFGSTPPGPEDPATSLVDPLSLPPLTDPSGAERSCKTISVGPREVRSVGPRPVRRITQWTERRNFEDYLAWRTERGFTRTFEAMLTRPFVIHYYDIAYFGEGIAARQSVQP